MIGFLRLVCGFCGFIFVWQIFGILGTLATLSQVDNISSNQETTAFSFIFVKIIIAVICGVPYFYLIEVINNIHQKQTGDDTLLIKSKWAL